MIAPIRPTNGGVSRPSKRPSRSRWPHADRSVPLGNGKPVGENARFQWGNPTRKTPIPRWGKPHYSHSGKTLTTLDISGEQAQPARSFLSTSAASPHSPKLPWTTPTVIEVAAHRQRTNACRSAAFRDCDATRSPSTEQDARAVGVERDEKRGREVDDGIPDFLRRKPNEATS